jgi:hypothetical protein
LGSEFQRQLSTSKQINSTDTKHSLDMKKILIAGMTLAGTMGLFAQGALVFNNVASGNPNVAGVNSVFHIYSPQVATPSVEVTGNVATAFSSPSARTGDFPVGTQTYTGTLIGGTAVGTGSTGWANGANYSVDLIAAPGDNAALNSLVFVAGTLETFKTTAGNAGFFVAPATDPTIPGTTFSGSGVTAPTSASCAVQAWYNAGGTIATYAAAVAAGVPYGQGAEFNVDGLGGGTVNPPNMINAQSFSLTSVPEPSTIALGVMGIGAFLARRRMLKK